MNIGNITAKWAKTDPSRPALIDTPTDRRISFGELDLRIRKLANSFCAIGVGRGDRVAILAKNSIE